MPAWLSCTGVRSEAADVWPSCMAPSQAAFPARPLRHCSLQARFATPQPAQPPVSHPTPPVSRPATRPVAMLDMKTEPSSPPVMAAAPSRCTPTQLMPEVRGVDGGRGTCHTRHGGRPGCAGVVQAGRRAGLQHEQGGLTVRPAHQPRRRRSTWNNTASSQPSYQPQPIPKHPAFFLCLRTST